MTDNIALRPLNWQTLGAGRLALWPRPRRLAISRLAEAGCTHVVTLLAEDEGALSIGHRVQNHNLQWIWLPRPNGAPPEGEEALEFANGILHLAELLDQGASLVVHCSAGIHRTGTVGYALLRLHGYAQDKALEVLGVMRPQIAPLTSQGLQPRHIAWVEEYVISPQQAQ
jgi:protein-tyrosine phosphatase